MAKYQDGNIEGTAFLQVEFVQTPRLWVTVFTTPRRLHLGLGN